jgi:hypothetical protein
MGPTAARAGPPSAALLRRRVEDQHLEGLQVEGNLRPGRERPGRPVGIFLPRAVQDELPGGATPLSNFPEMLSILLIPAALCYTFGKMVGNTRQGWAILAAMVVVFVVMLAACGYFEQQGTPVRMRTGAGY